MSPSTSTSTSTSTRWSPTPEQLMILEEMYKGGVRTPNASQIQKITVHLSFYGKIEGKNVFYWFQNHKARDRQKLRKKLSKQLQQQQLLQEQLFLHQYQNSQIYNTFNVLSLIDPPPPSSHHLAHDSPVEYPRQGGTDGATARMRNYTWNMSKHHPPNLQESENCMNITSNSDDWIMMPMKRGMGPSTSSSSSSLSCCSKRPLKTLELFPITAPSLKDQYHIQGTAPKPE